MSITACSKDVSLRSAATDGWFLLLPPATVPWEALNKKAPSPEVNVSKPVFRSDAAFVCFV